MKKLLLLFGICLTLFVCSKSNNSPPPAPQKYDLSVTASEGGSVSTTGGQYYQNTSVLVTATPDKGYEFSGWTGTSLTGASIMVKLTSNVTIKANKLMFSNPFRSFQIINSNMMTFLCKLIANMGA